MGWAEVDEGFVLFPGSLRFLRLLEAKACRAGDRVMLDVGWGIEVSGLRMRDGGIGGRGGRRGSFFEVFFIFDPTHQGNPTHPLTVLGVLW